MKRIDIEVDDKFKNELKSRALKSNKSLKGYIQDILSEHCKIVPLTQEIARLSKAKEDALVILNIIEASVKKGQNDVCLNWEDKVAFCFDGLRYRGKKAVQFASSLLNRVGLEMIWEENNITVSVSGTTRTKLQFEGFIFHFPNGITPDRFRKKKILIIEKLHKREFNGT